MRRGHAIILGEPGAGKSVVLLRAVLERCREAAALATPGASPTTLRAAFYLHANELVAACADQDAVAATVAVIRDRHRAEPSVCAWIRECVGAGRALLAVDGLEEITDRSRRVELYRQIFAHCEVEWHRRAGERGNPPTHEASGRFRAFTEEVTKTERRSSTCWHGGTSTTL